MYRIIGADHKEYGPASVDQVREWIALGRANAQTLTSREGSAEWKPLQSYPELVALLPLSPLPQSAPPRMDQASVQRQVNGPAILVLVVSVLNLLGALGGTFFSLFSVALPFEWDGLPNDLPRNLNLLVGLPAHLLDLAISVVSLFGGLAMLKLRNYTLAVVGAILMLVPCNCCCCLDLAAGIWALVVLMRPEVKAAFQ